MVDGGGLKIGGSCEGITKDPTKYQCLHQK